MANIERKENFIQLLNSVGGRKNANAMTIHGEEVASFWVRNEDFNMSSDYDWVLMLGEETLVSIFTDGAVKIYDTFILDEDNCLNVPLMCCEQFEYFVKVLDGDSSNIQEKWNEYICQYLQGR